MTLTKEQEAQVARLSLVEFVNETLRDGVVACPECGEFYDRTDETRECSCGVFVVSVKG